MLKLSATAMCSIRSGVLSQRWIIPVCPSCSENCVSSKPTYTLVFWDYFNFVLFLLNTCNCRWKSNFWRGDVGTVFRINWFSLFSWDDKGSSVSTLATCAWFYSLHSNVQDSPGSLCLLGIGQNRQARFLLSYKVRPNMAFLCYGLLSVFPCRPSALDSCGHTPP